MLEVRVTDEFAAWFDALEDKPAEGVATALEVIEKLGPERVAPGSSEWLLWYEHRDAPEFVACDDWTQLRESARAVVAQLDSEAFASKLRALPRERAVHLMRALESIKTASSVHKRGLALLVAGAAAKSGRSIDPHATLRLAHRAVTSAAGLAESDVALHSSALRELTVCSASWRCRILYGVDVRRELALAVLGEPLDRSFYGDSVRRAERVWRLFLQSNIEARSLPRR